MRSRGRSRSMEGLIALVLFGVFAACVLSVLLTGARVYARLTERDRDAFDRRTVIQYVAAKVRGAPGGASVAVEDFGGESCLALREDIDGEVYVTRVYCREGWLMELFTADVEGFAPSDGQKVIECAGMDFSLDGGVLTVTAAADEGPWVSLSLCLRGGAAS